MKVLNTKTWVKFAGMALISAGSASLLYGDAIAVTYAPAGVQSPNSATICSSAPGTQCWIGQENFNSGSAPTTATVLPTLVSVGGLTGSISASYSGGYQIYAADQYGGAGGTGYYPEIFAANGSYTMTLSASGLPGGVNYFGLWFSALDAGNSLKFYDGNTLVESFGPQQFQSLVGACPDSNNAFCGNPNANRLGQDSGEQFAFLNFYDFGGSFTSIVFSESGGGGFESDNHTVGYMNPITLTGTVITPIPEPDSVVLLLTGMLALLALMRRRIFAVLN